MNGVNELTNEIVGAAIDVHIGLLINFKQRNSGPEN